MSTNIDWSKLIGGIIAAVLITMQVGIDGRFESHGERTVQAVEKLENNTMHKSTVEKHIALLEAEWSVMNNRVLILERAVNSFYQEDDGT